MDFVNALKKQFYFCLTEYNYRCGIYISYVNEAEYMKNVHRICELAKHISNNNELNDSIDCIRYSKYDSCVRFKNGNFIKILRASDNARGNKFTGIIIDNKISIREKNDYIYPYLIPLRDNDSGFLRKDDKPFDRIFICDIDFH